MPLGAVAAGLLLISWWLAREAQEPRLRWAVGMAAPRFYLRNAPSRDFYFAASGYGYSGAFSYSASGEQRWFTSLAEGQIEDSSAAFKRAGDLIALHRLDGSTLMLDSRGQTAFEIDSAELLSLSLASPPSGGSAAYLYQNQTGSYGLDQAGSLRWWRKDLVAYEPSPRIQALAQGRLLAVDQSGGGARVVALSPEGQQTWAAAVMPAGCVPGSQYIAVSELIVAAGGDTVLGSTALPGRCAGVAGTAQPFAPGMGRWDESAQGEVFCLDTAGNCRWRFPAQMPYRDAPQCDQRGAVVFRDGPRLWRADRNGHRSLSWRERPGRVCAAWGLSESGLAWAQEYRPLPMTRSSPFLEFIWSLPWFEPPSPLNTLVILDPAGREIQRHRLGPSAAVLRIRRDGRGYAVYDGQVQQLQMHSAD